jgi:hypothetical protein
MSPGWEIWRWKMRIWEDGDDRDDGDAENKTEMMRMVMVMVMMMECVEMCGAVWLD